MYTFNFDTFQDPSCSLQSLHLGFNDFTEQGADLLANALQVLLTLSHWFYLVQTQTESVSIPDCL